MKKILFIAIILCLFFSHECFGQDLLKGEIIRTTQNKLSITLGERAITNLGLKNGVVKGDIFRVTEAKDPDLKGPVGRCAVLDVQETESTCEIFKMSKEIRKGNLVFLNSLYFNDEKLYGIIFNLLNRTVEPYEPYRNISVYIYDFFDENNNITKLSELIKNEMKSIFSQKKRINLVSDSVGKGLFLYREEHANTKFIEDYMNRSDINVFITGSYKISNDNVNLTVFLVDREYKDYQLSFITKADGYSRLASEITVPYAPFERKDSICNLLYKPKRYKPQRDEKKYFIDKESGDDPFVQQNVGRIDFNIVSPVDVMIKTENVVFKFDDKKEHKLTLPKGRHRFSASFRRGYYYNDALMYTSDNEVKKEMLLLIDRGGEINIEFYVNPSFEKENIEFKIYRKAEREYDILKPVYEKDYVNQIEVYKY